MTPAETSFLHLLKRNHQSATKARLAVFRALLAEEPLGMHELVGRTPHIDRASVYRAVELFERLGIVQRLHTGWKYKLELTDTFTNHHHHLTCTHCGRSITINEDELEQLIAKLAARYRFVPTAHQIEVQGLCEACRSAATIS